MPHFNVHFKHESGRRDKYCVEALSKDDAMKDAIKWRILPENQNKELLKVIGPLGRTQTPKQHLAQQYRSCIGALAMAEFNISHIVMPMTDEYAKPRRDRNQAIQNVLKAKRDVADCFSKLGLKVKGT